MRGKYDKAAYFDERLKMMQSWADKLDMLSTPKNFVQFVVGV